MRLFVVATLSMYGAWTTTMTSDASRSACVRARLGVLVALRIGQEHLDAVGVHLGRAGQRTAVQEFVVVGQTRADVDTDRVNRHMLTTLVRSQIQVYPYRWRHIIVLAA